MSDEESRQGDGVDWTRHDFDHTDPGTAQNLYGMLAAAREQCPVMHGSRHGGFWALTRYADVVSAANDHRLFTTAQGVTIPPLGLPTGSVPLTVEPPDHKHYRRALQPYFTLPAVSKLEPMVRQVVIEHVEAFAGRGHADLIEEYAAPIPCIVIALLLGLDREIWPIFSEWVRGMHVTAQAGDLTARDEYSAKLADLLITEVDHRLSDPRDDLLTTIAQTQVNGEAAPDVMRYGMAQQILVAGHDTTVNGIGNLLRHLLERPGFSARAAREPAFLDRAIEESLRFESPALGLARTVISETMVAGTTLAAGDKVLVMYGSANHDPRRFPDPERYDPDRRDRPAHVAFGYGRHRCIGEYLARLEMRVAAQELLTRIPGLRLAADSRIEMRHALVRGPISLPVVWQAG
jgi:cytochrome P450